MNMNFKDSEVFRQLNKNKMSLRQKENTCNGKWDKTKAEMQEKYENYGEKMSCEIDIGDK